MKRLLIVSAVLLIAASGTAMAQISGSSHDLSAGLSGTSSETCVFCHTPHNANVAVPLWNHAGGTGTFSTYTSGTMSASGDWTGTGGDAQHQSDMCMGCHDGVTGLGDIQHESQIGLTPTNSATAMGAVDANLGTSLLNDHPVNVPYLEGAAEELNTIASVTGAGLVLPGNTIQCTSCHDAHNQGTAGTFDAPFLAISNEASALCTTCHDK